MSYYKPIKWIEFFMKGQVSCDRLINVSESKPPRNYVFYYLAGGLFSCSSNGCCIKIKEAVEVLNA